MACASTVCHCLQRQLQTRPVFLGWTRLRKQRWSSTLESKGSGNILTHTHTHTKMKQIYNFCPVVLSEISDCSCYKGLPKAWAKEDGFSHSALNYQPEESLLKGRNQNKRTLQLNRFASVVVSQWKGIPLTVWRCRMSPTENSCSRKLKDVNAF